MDTNQTVAEFVSNYFGYKYDFLGVVAAVHVGITVLFGFIFAFSIKVFNFQKRWLKNKQTKQMLGLGLVTLGGMIWSVS